MDYIEDGILSGVLHEKLDVKLISNMIIEQLQDKGFLKKNYKQDSLDLDDFENLLVEHIDESLSLSLQDYFDGGVEKIKIENPEAFSCCYWE